MNGFKQGRKDREAAPMRRSAHRKSVALGSAPGCVRALCSFPLSLNQRKALGCRTRTFCDLVSLQAMNIAGVRTVLLSLGFGS